MNEYTNFRIGSLPCAASAEDPVLTLRERLEGCGFDEHYAALCSARFADVPARLLAPAMLRELKDEALARLFWLSQWVSAKSVERALGASLVARLEQWGILVREGERLASSIDLIKTDGCWLATDRRFGGELRSDVVYSPGQDSLAMCRWTPRWRARMALDLCTGSGIQALICGQRSHYVEGFDLNARAVEFARFNAQMNGRDAYFFESDLYAACENTVYDVIMSNPPWVPAPPGDVELFRGGGATGEFLVERICRGLGERLSDVGRAALYVEYPKFRGEEYVERVRRWLGPGTWGVALLHRCHFTTVQYVSQQTASHFEPERDFDRWMASYEAQGIVGMGAGELFIFKNAATSWTVEREGGFPLRDVSEEVSAWLETCRNLDSGGVCRVVPRVYDDGEGNRIAQWPPGTFPPYRFRSDTDERTLKINGVLATDSTFSLWG